LGARARPAALEPPVVIVIGEVVGLAGRLAWFRPECAVEHALA
jgi:siroheme synthase